MIRTVKVTVSRTETYKVMADTPEDVERIIEDAVMSRLIEPDDDIDIKVESVPATNPEKGDAVLYYDEDDHCAHFGRICDHT